jgi:hypothetical protein
VNLINNASAGGALENRLSISPSSGRQDENLDGALCLRSLHLGRDAVSGERLRGRERARHRRLLRGIERVRAWGDLNGIPTLIATGRADGVVAPNHASRAYFGLNQLVEGQESRLRYYEVLNAQHLDALNGLPGFNVRFVPLHHYFLEVLNLMYEHLREGVPLPPSQVVRAITSPQPSCSCSGALCQVLGDRRAFRTDAAALRLRRDRASRRDHQVRRSHGAAPSLRGRQRPADARRRRPLAEAVGPADRRAARCQTGPRCRRPQARGHPPSDLARRHDLCRPDGCGRRLRGDH